MKRFLLCLAAFVGGAALFFSLRHLGVPGGDTEVITSHQIGPILWSNHFVYYLREPLCHSMIQSIYLLTMKVAPLAAGPHADLAARLQLPFALFCSLSGGLYLALLAWYCRRPVFWLIVLFSVETMVFVGHMEYYAPAVVALTLYFMLLARALEPGSRVGPIQVTLAFVVSFLFHKATLFFLPAMAWLVWSREGGRWQRRRWPARTWEWSMLLIIAMAAIDMFPPLVYTYHLFGLDWMCVFVNERFIDWLTPLTPAMARHFERTSTTGMWYVYTFGTPLHWAYFFGFVLAGSPLGLGVLWARRRELGSDAARALLTAAACGLLWIFMWQPRGLWRDWDLFCLATLPINLLAGGLLAGLYRGHSSSSSNE